MWRHVHFYEKPVKGFCRAHILRLFVPHGETEHRIWKKRVLQGPFSKGLLLAVAPLLAQLEGKSSYAPAGVLLQMQHGDQVRHQYISPKLECVNET